MRTTASKLRLCLFLLRLGVAIVFIMWTVDKFLNPAHTAAVFDKFYFVSSLSNAAAYIIGALQLIIVIAFIAGVAKSYSYLFILIMHFVSTIASYERYLDPWTSPNLLFYAAFPMLAACFVLWFLRDEDTLFTFKT